MSTADFYAQLIHPDGRAKGGEPCVKCGSPISGGEHFTLRDRHVCSSRCNDNLKRQFKRMVASGRAEVDASPDPHVIRTKPRPYVFRELPDSAPGEVPVEYDGLGPLDGDVVERVGRRALCRVLDGEVFSALCPWVEDANEGCFLSIHQDSGQALLWGLTSGTIDQVIYGSLDMGTGEVRTGAFTFEYEDQQYWWGMEHVRCIDAEGIDYDWRAPLILTTEQFNNPHTPRTYWSPDFARRSESRLRASRSLGHNRRRVRLDAATLERVDPMEIFVRDKWTCGICKREIDPDLKWPAPMAASLDHILALAAGGDHSLVNVQAAHLVCNLRKGAR